MFRLQPLSSNPLFTLRISAKHREARTYGMSKRVSASNDDNSNQNDQCFAFSLPFFQVPPGSLIRPPSLVRRRSYVVRTGDYCEVEVSTSIKSHDRLMLPSYPMRSSPHGPSPKEAPVVDPSTIYRGALGLLRQLGGAL